MTGTMRAAAGRAYAVTGHPVRALPPFGPTEGLHPNQIGQQALQACIRAATVGGTARSGRSDVSPGWAEVDATGLPLVRVTPEQGTPR